MLRVLIRIPGFLFLFMPASLYSQVDSSGKVCTASIEGRVLDEHDQTPLEYATIYILEVNKGTLSGETGFYIIEGICDGTYTFRITHLGCSPIEQKVVIKGKTIHHFYPEHHAELLNSIAIIRHKPAEQSTQQKNEVSIEKMEQSKGLSLGDALKNIPGVQTFNTGSTISKPVIHGLHSNRILILNNGIRQEGQQWGVEHAPEIDPFTAGKMAVIKGANSVRYGSDAIAGVILIDPKPLRDSAGINGELNLVGMSNGRGGTVSMYMDGNFRKLSPLSWRIQGTLKQSGNVSAPDYFLINTGVKEYNFSYTLLWKKPNYGAEVYYSQFNTTIGIFGASHIGNLSDLYAAFASKVPLETGGFSYAIGRPYQHSEHELFKARFFVNTGEKGKLSLIYARQYNLRYEYDKHSPLNDSLAALNRPDLQFEITTHTADLIWEHNPIKNISGTMGISAITQGNTYEGRALIPNFRNHSGGVFWIERWKKNKLEVEGGIRYDYKWMQVFKYAYTGNGKYTLISPIHRFNAISGTAGIIYKVDSALNLSLNLGTAWRAPSVSELYSDGLHHGAASIEYGNDALGSEIAYNAAFTLRYTPTARLHIEFAPYTNYITNFIYRQALSEPVLTLRGAFPAFNYKQADAILSGFDLHASYSLYSFLEITGKASLLRAWNLSEKSWLILMPADRYETELTYRFKRRNKIRGASVSSSFQYVNKQWRVPANSDFVAPPPAYYLVNVHGSLLLRVKKQDIEFGLSINNLLNHSYRDYLDRFRYFSDAMGRNVTVRIKIPFNTSFNPKKSSAYAR